MENKCGNFRQWKRANKSMARSEFGPVTSGLESRSSHKFFTLIENYESITSWIKVILYNKARVKYDT